MKSLHCPHCKRQFDRGMSDDLGRIQKQIAALPPDVRERVTLPCVVCDVCHRFSMLKDGDLVVLSPAHDLQLQMQVGDVRAGFEKARRCCGSHVEVITVEGLNLETAETQPAKGDR